MKGSDLVQELGDREVEDASAVPLERKCVAAFEAGRHQFPEVFCGVGEGLETSPKNE